MTTPAARQHPQPAARVLVVVSDPTGTYLGELTEPTAVMAPGDSRRC
ncbi:hypothetical protein ACFT1A_29545 [Rhodococcus sp. NPDC057135]